MAEVDVVSRIAISCVVAHALHAWLLVSPSVTTRSLITNPVANMRCACKASENPSVTGLVLLGTLEYDAGSTVYLVGFAVQGQVCRTFQALRCGSPSWLTPGQKFLDLTRPKPPL